jgi:hypothetical protein
MDVAAKAKEGGLKWQMGGAHGSQGVLAEPPEPFRRYLNSDSIVPCSPATPSRLLRRN